MGLQHPVLWKLVPCTLRANCGYGLKRSQTGGHLLKLSVRSSMSHSAQQLLWLRALALISITTRQIMSRIIRSTLSGVVPRNNIEILSGCHFKLSACIVLNMVAGMLASGHAFRKKLSTFDAVRSALRPDFTGQGMASRGFPCVLGLVPIKHRLNMS